MIVVTPIRVCRGRARAVGAALLTLSGGLSACNAQVVTEPGPGSGVLFIGNSLTGANDLPGMVADLSTAAGTPIATHAVVAGNVSLADHWNEGVARDAVGRGGWSAVVFQQGPSTLPESREHLIHWSNIVARAVRDAGADPFVYMVWPPLQGDWQRGIDSYRMAADSSGSGIMPVAEALRAAWARDSELPLLSGDDFHPSPLGTYLAALVIVARLLDRSPIGLPSDVGARIQVPAGTALLLQQAAADAIAGTTAQVIRDR